MTGSNVNDACWSRMKMFIMVTAGWNLRIWGWDQCSQKFVCYYHMCTLFIFASNFQVWSSPGAERCKMKPTCLRGSGHAFAILTNARSVTSVFLIKAFLTLVCLDITCNWKAVFIGNQTKLRPANNRTILNRNHSCLHLKYSMVYHKLLILEE